ncbi:lipid IV(A) 3-deoxy-D-manno-octulosonic acid transferase [Acidihalobacter ferrooxydans]|uniref:3-deoxy-D-manno-octulosonic acid transferase n=1 Tax=Acidihalobacter ferrooxydans TaxID=1765967 RepID=A0A1P8UFZ3_9GAMM|nr:lipid IV(A) 3-deoxy-D-manno-octulosonic acid transferase [Acidihalobacter ferrooxydans]APZ42756.1 3-deoxy-D-manno-octulosonic acid transferase [Acidihalobacter ferrooxydans]
MRGLYTLLLYLIAPAVVLRLLWRSRRNPGYRQRIPERFGFGRAFAQRPRIWIHAVSVGETIASVPLVRRLQQQYPGYAVLVTNTTPTGAAQVRRLFGDTVENAYLPYDLPGAVERFLERARPRVVLCMETEIWPNLFAACARRNVPVFIANARLSARSARAYARVAALTRATLGQVATVAARDARDAQRFRALGAPRVFVAGNLKHDLDVPATARETGMVLRAALGADRPVWIAASTHAGEDEIVLDAHRRLCGRLPDALLILVPRHPERFDEAAARSASAGFVTRRRSLDIVPDAQTQVFIGDTLGELMCFYAAGDVAFVAGSFVEVGGHNPLEPVALGLPVLTGPQVFNFEQVYAALFAANAARQVDDAGALAMALVELFAAPEQRARMGEGGERVLAAHRGATDHLAALLADALG